MAELVYILCGLASLAATLLLVRSYFKNQERNPLVFWSSVCFSFMTVNNIFLVFDRVIYPSYDFLIFRSVTLLIGFLVLLFGLIWNTV